MAGTHERRVLALILPELACELLRLAPEVSRHQVPHPVAVVLLDGVDARTPAKELDQRIHSQQLLDAVDARARRLGIREGQSVAEARGMAAALSVHALPRMALSQALGRLAEGLLDRASVAAIEPPDTIWLEIGGVAHLLGGEAELASELLERMQSLGHSARVAVAPGPRAAQLLARWTASDHPRGLLVSPEQVAKCLEPLPITVLPLERSALEWLGRLGLFTLGALRQLPPVELFERLGPQSKNWIELLQGQDQQPLVALRPRPVLREQLWWQEPVQGLEPLRFVLYRLLLQLEARLLGRGQAAQRLQLTFGYEPGIARHLGVVSQSVLSLDLAAPLRHADELQRVVLARLGQFKLLAPIIELAVEVTRLTSARERQLSLSSLLGDQASCSCSQGKLPALIAELEAEVGKQNVGLLYLADSHRPEDQSLLIPCRDLELGEYKGHQERSGRTARVRGGSRLGSERRVHLRRRQPTRLLPHPVPISVPLRRGSTLFFDHQAYVIERLALELRLEDISWWNQSPVSRDYLRVWMKGSEGGIEAVLYVDRDTGKRFLHGVVD